MYPIYVLWVSTFLRGTFKWRKSTNQSLFRILIEDSDQNLKYLGLLAMSKILKTSPKSVASHKVPVRYRYPRCYGYLRVHQRHCIRVEPFYVQ